MCQREGMVVDAQTNLLTAVSDALRLLRTPKVDVRLLRCLQDVIEQVERSVMWTETSEGFWKCSGCPIAWKLTGGTPTENGMHYCPGCGYPIRQESRCPAEDCA